MSSGINISQRISNISNQAINEQISKIAERINKIEDNQKKQDELISDLVKKQEESNLSINDNISKIDDKINKIFDIISAKNKNKDGCEQEQKKVHANEDDELFDSAEEEVIYEIPSVKRYKNNMKIPACKKKAKRGPYKKESGPIYYYYSINNKAYKYTRVRKNNDYEEYRCSCISCKPKGKYILSIKNLSMK